jgi:biopolymer transport protein ExbD
MTIAKRRVFKTATVVTLWFACVVAGNSSEPGSTLQTQTSRTVRPAIVTLNADPFGTTADLSALTAKLQKIFADRRTYHAYAAGMETRVDLPESDRIERTVSLEANRSVSMESVTNVIAALLEAGASPVVFPVRTGAVNVSKLKPNPLTLMVQLKDSETDSGKSDQRPKALGWDVPTSSIVVDIPYLPVSDSLGSVELTNERVTIDEKRIDKTALQKEIADRVKASPRKHAMGVKFSPGVTYGAFEDFLRIAFTAGVRRINLEKFIHWDQQKTVTAAAADLTLTVPAELEEEVSSQPNKNDDVTWTVHSFNWSRLRTPLEVSVTATNWDKGFPPQTGGASPEELLAQRYRLTEREKSEGAAPIEELNYLEISGVKGIFFRAAQFDNHNRVWLNWQTLRYHRGKAQELQISIRGRRSDLDKLMAIVHSVSIGTSR